ncbi:GlxA family transcriptional regulator [Amnibacterium kyonggiense]|uniref:AraC family transcriptional regulator with amidase-like domain n=1 Tax=Amnibacterium kyonggiense TaxID=595671 RepID=A0A4R7FRA4_9MICO|nr:helix-turn-helix domain-containing protein [Amnibacterium kyonggiense]TDS80313.1 AraC family transcriptional regulator with amidase-like domain [Amnibacterium kyonggiense]
MTRVEEERKQPREHRIVVLVLESALALDVGIPMQMFRRRHGAPYEVTMAGIRRGVVPAAGGFGYAVERGVEALEYSDTVIVPGYADLASPIDPAAIRALRDAAARGARIVSVCTGAFALAAAGLLDGHRATTHWQQAAELAARYPRVTVDPDVLFVDEGRVLTSAGVAAGIDLCLHLIRRDHGVRVAADVARQIVAAPYRSGGQAQYLPHALPERTGSTFARTREWALGRLGEPLTVAELAAHAGVSSRTFARRFVEDTGHPPLQWLLRARLDRARELLEATDLGLDQIAAQAGLGSAHNLRSHFHRIVGTTPSAYRSAFAST